MAEIDKTHARGAGICGILILLCGIGNTLCGILWVVKLVGQNKVDEEYAYLYGSGLYSGIPLIIAGALGIAVWLKHSKEIMSAFVVFCIIACILAALQAIVAGVLYMSILHHVKCLESNSRCDDFAKFVVTSILVWTILSIFGAVLTSAGSIIGCTTTCCAFQASSPGVVVGQVPMQSYDASANDTKL